MSLDPSPLDGGGQAVQPAVDPEVHAVIRRSLTPVSVDGYKLGEPKALECPDPDCNARALLDPDPETPGWQEMAHSAACQYRRDGE